MEEPQSVAARTGAVESRFENIVHCIERKEDATTVSSEDVVDAWDKFKLWAGNIGARQTPDSAASLESRLQGARRVLEQVINLLDTIQEACDDLFEIASGNQENRLMTSDLGLYNQDSTPVWSPTMFKKYEDQDLLELISKSIGNLLRITVLIRKATPRDRFAKALQSNNPFMDEFDIAYVAERYPKLATPDARWLCERLGRAITKRRQFLRYSRDHSRRIAGHGDAASVVLQKSSNPVEHDGNLSGAVDRSTAPSIASGMHTIHSGSYAAQTHASTRASTLDIAELRRVQEIEAEDEDKKSYVSAGSSFQMGDENSTLHLPTLEEVSQGSDVFECPICFDIQTISRESSWRRHAFQDLKTYVCTGEGTCDSKLFGDSRSWLDHELQCHRQQWACTLCPKGPFRNKKIFEDHLTQTHGSIVVVEDLLPAFVSMGLRAVDAIPAADCPFCDEWAESLESTTPLPDSTDLGDIVITVDPKQYRRHVSHHLEQLALFALPRLTVEHQNDNASEEANVSHSTIDRLDSQSTGNEQSSDVEWDPDPPLHKAAARGDFEEVKRLVNDGADVHLRGETWGNVLDAALSHPGASESGILRFLRLELELENYEPRLAGGLPSAVPAGDNLAPPESSGSTKRHKCPYCEREFSRIQHLKSHRSTHAQEMPLVCPDCQMRFRRSKDLKRHAKLHVGESDPIQEKLTGSAYIRDASAEKGTEKGSSQLGEKAELAIRRFDQAFSGVSVAALPRTTPGLLDTREIPSNWTSVSGRKLSDELPDYFEYISPADLVRHDLGQGKETQAEKAEDVEDPGRSSAHRYDASRYMSEERASPVYDTVNNSPVGKSGNIIIRAVPRHLRVAVNESPESLEAVQARHRKEQQDLQWRITSKKVNATKKTRKGVNDECAKLEQQLKERQQHELAVLERDGKAIHLTPDPEDTTGESKDDKDKHLTEPPRLKGILKKPTSEFPEPPALAKGAGVSATAKRGNIPPGARWTKISRSNLDPRVLVTGNERYEERDGFVVVKRLLSKEEIDAYIMATERLLIARREEKKERSQRMRQEHWRPKELGTLTEELRERRRRQGAGSEDEGGSGDDGPSLPARQEENLSTSSGQPPQAQGTP